MLGILSVPRIVLGNVLRRFTRCISLLHTSNSWLASKFQVSEQMQFCHHFLKLQLQVLQYYYYSEHKCNHFGTTNRLSGQQPFHKIIPYWSKKRISTHIQPTLSASMSSMYVFAGRIQFASPIKLPRFLRKNKKSKTTDESDPNLGAADQMVQHPPFLQKKKSLSNVSCAGTNSTDSLSSSPSTESLTFAFRTLASVSSDDSTLQLPAAAPEIVELLPAEPFYFQNMDLPPSSSDDEWGYFVDFAAG
jgi:hypothetical protein